jgi:hypothetical protein
MRGASCAEPVQTVEFGSEGWAEICAERQGLGGSFLLILRPAAVIRGLLDLLLVRRSST